jgi:predicted  nucleic acid-binding Zn-ribbon protein
MAGETDNLVLEMLKRIRSSQERTELDISDMKVRMSSMERHLGEIQIQVSQLNSRMDTIDERVSRMERRLELKENV